jgi:hypothetical protein
VAFLNQQNIQNTDVKSPTGNKLNSAGVSTPCDENIFIRTSLQKGELLRISTSPRKDYFDVESNELRKGRDRRNLMQ